MAAGQNIGNRHTSIHMVRPEHLMSVSSAQENCLLQRQHPCLVEYLEIAVYPVAYCWPASNLWAAHDRCCHKFALTTGQVYLRHKRSQQGLQRTIGSQMGREWHTLGR